MSNVQSRLARWVPRARPSALALRVAFAVIGAACSVFGHACSPAEDPSPGADVAVDAGVADAAEACSQVAGVEFCAPELPRGISADECPSGRLAGEEFFEGGGVCLPDLRDWTCPTGWVPRPMFSNADGDDVPEGLEQVFACDPAFDGSAECPPGQLVRPDAAGCQSVGLPCPPDGAAFHSEADVRARAPDYAGAILYADGGVVRGGDGRRQAPFPSVFDAIDEARPGDIVVLAPGRYEGGFAVPDDVALVGSCTERTFVRNNGDTGPAVRLAGSAGHVSDVRIESDGMGVHMDGAQGGRFTLAALHVTSAGHALYGQRAGSMTLRDTVVASATARPGDSAVGVAAVDGFVADVHSLVVRNADFGVAAIGLDAHASVHGAVFIELPRSGSDLLGVAAVAQEGATLDLAEAVIREVVSGAVQAHGGSRVTIRDVHISDNVRGTTRRIPALFATTDSMLTGERIVIDRWSGVTGVSASAGAEFDVTDLVISHVEPGAADAWAVGVYVYDTGSGRVARALIEHCADRGVVGTDGTLDVVDTVIRHIAQPNAFVRGFGATTRHQLALQRTLIEHTRFGVGVRGTGTLTDVVIRDTDTLSFRTPEGELGRAGRAAELSSGTLRAERLLVERAVISGISAGGPGEHSLTLIDTVVSEVRSVDGLAHGIVAQDGASLQMDHVLVSGCEQLGVHGSGAAPIDASHLTVRGPGGRGIEITDGAALEARNVDIANCSGVGLLTAGDGTSVVASETAIRGTTAEECGPGEPECRPSGGHGAFVFDAGSLRLDDFAIAGNALGGLVIGDEAAVTAEQGTIAENAVGVNVTASQFDLDRAFQSVRLDDNETDIAALSIDIPTVSDSLEFGIGVAE